MAELKPCPFCGREVKIVEYTVDEPFTFCDCGFEIRCPNCDIRLREHTRCLTGIEHMKAKNSLIERWNRRAYEKGPED